MWRSGKSRNPQYAYHLWIEGCAFIYLKKKRPKKKNKTKNFNCILKYTLFNRISIDEFQPKSITHFLFQSINIRLSVKSDLTWYHFIVGSHSRFETHVQLLQKLLSLASILLLGRLAINSTLLSTFYLQGGVTMFSSNQDYIFPVPWSRT